MFSTQKADFTRQDFPPCAAIVFSFCSFLWTRKKCSSVIYHCIPQRGKSQNNKRSGEENVETGGRGASGDVQAVEGGQSGRRDSLNQYGRSAGIWNGAQGHFKERHIRPPIVVLTWGVGPVSAAQQINGCAFCLYLCVCRHARRFVLCVWSTTQLPETGSYLCTAFSKFIEDTQKKSKCHSLLCWTKKKMLISFAKTYTLSWLKQ